MSVGEFHRKIAIGITIGICLATLSAAAKAYIDVERLKTKFELVLEVLKETRQDVKEIKLILIKRKD